MTALTSVILPVFIVLAFGYIATWRGYFAQGGIDALMKFTQGFAIPCLLFQAISTLDPGQHFELTLLAAFYLGALGGFAIGTFGARFLFGRSWEDAVAIGFVGLFSNSVMLGLPITERAYGADALAANYAIIALHAPFCYGIGITVMEVVRAGGADMRHLPARVARAMFRNALIVGIGLGFVVNVTGLPLPVVFTDALDLMVRAAIPVALFALGGVLYTYRPEGDLRAILFIVAVSLIAHPAITYGLARLWGLGDAALRSAVITAAMAPGVNAYLFAGIYERAQRVAASAVLIGTGLCIVTASVWITLLP